MKRARKASSDSDSGGARAPKAPKIDKKFTAPGDDTGVMMIIVGTWPALELSNGSVFTISNQYFDKAWAEKAL